MQDENISMQGETKVSEGQRRSLVRLTTAWAGIIPTSEKDEKGNSHE